MDWDEIKFCVGLTVIFSFLLYVRFCDIIIVSITLFIYSFIANVNSYITNHELNAATKENVNKLKLENTKESVFPASNREPFSGDFHLLNNFDNTFNDCSSCIAHCDADSVLERILQDFDQSSDISGNQDTVNNRWTRFKRGVRKYICCCCCSDEKD